MSFFIRNSRKLTKRVKPSKGSAAKVPKLKKTKLEDEEILSEESDIEEGDLRSQREKTPISEDETETAQEKRLRLAKKVLEEIEKQEKERFVEEADVTEAVGKRLREEALEQAGKLRRRVADTLEVDAEHSFFLKCKDHKLSVTCAVASSDGLMFSASKDSSIVKWCLEEKKKLNCIRGGKNSGENGHTQPVQALALSTDGKFLASGCEGKLIHIWDPSSLTHVHTFRGHRDAISGLAFRKNSHTLFSSSKDKSVKVWNLDEMAYVETLFGHTDSITSVDALIRERALTSGGRDGTVRLWKIVEESQLIYNGHSGSIDCVRFVNDEHFVSSGDDGNLSLWGLMKKKPLYTQQKAHGEEENGVPRWISSVAALQNTDLIASGSNSGEIKFWKCGENFRNLLTLQSHPVEGFVNSLHFCPTSDGAILLAGIGQEHRLGRWWRHKEAKNGILCITLKKKT
ncbi:U3 small nucleolar RNA-interacting protein 2-like isoform X2 [Artemia franciscana]|uniref:U3 small nucleolar RNA-interacting protein 2 n=1 Tax=Artemia franciscana TaxID=6661 RepID=A0AA88KWW9_ARTSF|nr:hypothetical protein QYM36_017325 [Artemia franciscana]